MQCRLSPSSLNLLEDCPRCFWLQMIKNIILEKPTLTRGYKTGYKYSLTSKGKNLGKEIYNNKLSSKEKNILVNLNNRFKNFSPTELLKYVYQRYPVFIENSEFKS